MKKLVIISIVLVILFLTFAKVKAEINWTNARIVDACPQSLLISVEELPLPPELMGEISGVIYVDNILYELTWIKGTYNPTLLTVVVPIESTEINNGWVYQPDEPHYAVPILKQNIRCNLIYLPNLEVNK